ncbi:MAG: 50S ribosomal protein L6 [Alphaproteobacteria bacterium]|nr:50S ribosomal protein L6 [Alphaproteobacteria bacterium]
MTRIGKDAVVIPQGISVRLEAGQFYAKGPKGELQMAVMPYVDVVIEGNSVTVSAKSTVKRAQQAWGSMRALIQNMVLGVSEGTSRILEVNGVGYRAAVKGRMLELQLGFSHPVNMNIPQGLSVEIIGDRNNQIKISGASKQCVGQFASDIRILRPPEPYKGKGVKYLEERILRKEGKKK